MVISAIKENEGKMGGNVVKMGILLLYMMIREGKTFPLLS
jgi:hypothetical protein